MHELSHRMLAAGWVIEHTDTGNWTVQGSDGKLFHYDNKEWSLPRPEIEAALVHDESRIAHRFMTPFRTLSLLTARRNHGRANPLTERMCRERRVAGKAVLRLGAGQDVQGKALLLSAGATWAVDYDPNYHPNTAVLARHYDLVLCAHVLDCLPPIDRREVYREIQQTTAPGGSAFLSVYDSSALPELPDRRPLDDGYIYPAGRHKVFYKPYARVDALREVQRFLGGFVELAWTGPNELVLHWCAPNP